MRIFSWVQSKINGKHEKKPELPVCSSAARYHNWSDTRKEEFSDWPHGLLAIGTFGNSNMKGDQQKEDVPATPRPSLELQNFNVEEVDELQKELAKLLAAYEKSETAEVDKSGTPSSDKSRNKPSGLEIDVTTCRKNYGDGGELSPNSRIFLNGARDTLAENRSALNQRSFSFLFKKLLACRSGFAPAPSLRDPIQASIIEKLLKAVVHTKIYPQNSTPISTRKYLEKKPVDEKGVEDKRQAKADIGSKWVKTDSEYIVLEI